MEIDPENVVFQTSSGRWNLNGTLPFRSTGETFASKDEALKAVGFMLHGYRYGRKQMARDFSRLLNEACG